MWGGAVVIRIVVVRTTHDQEVVGSNGAECLVFVLEAYCKDSSALKIVHASNGPTRKVGFFAQSELIMLASRQAAQLSIHSFQENQYCCTSARDLIKDTQLIERERKRKRKKEKSKKPSTQRDSNPGPLCHEMCALLLCYNHCQRKIRYNGQK